MKESALTLKKLFRSMAYIRMVEEAIATEYKKQEMRCPTHLCIGQEAIAVGVSACLQAKDSVFSNHRSHGHYLAKGGNLDRMIAELYGKETGCSRGYGGSQHLIDRSVNFLGATPIVASCIPIAVGNAFATVMKKKKGITVVYFGDAATEEGIFAESLNFAALKKLPVLFICENNLYSTNTPTRDRQPDRSIAGIAKVLGVPSYQADGNDVVGVYHLIQTIVFSMRKKQQPYFVEFMTYRQREHCGPDVDGPKYRPEKEKAYWLKKDPIARLEKELFRMHVLTVQEKEHIMTQIVKDIDHAFDFAKRSPFARETLTQALVYAN